MFALHKINLSMSELLKQKHLGFLNLYTSILKSSCFLEYIFLITQELKLDPSVGYHAIELLQR